MSDHLANMDTWHPDTWILLLELKCDLSVRVPLVSGAVLCDTLQDGSAMLLPFFLCPLGCCQGWPLGGVSTAGLLNTLYGRHCTACLLNSFIYSLQLW